MQLPSRTDRHLHIFPHNKSIYFSICYNTIENMAEVMNAQPTAPVKIDAELSERQIRKAKELLDKNIRAYVNYEAIKAG